MTVDGAFVACRGCAGLVPAAGIEPEHSYVGASPGCWIWFTEARGRETYETVFAAHGRSITDVYMVQHPGVPGRQSAQSVWVHLVGLYLVLERGFAPLQATLAMRRILAGRTAFTWLEPPASLGDTTIADVHAATDAETYVATVRRWADDAWRAWAPYHDRIEKLVDDRAW